MMMMVVNVGYEMNFHVFFSFSFFCAQKKWNEMNWNDEKYNMNEENKTKKKQNFNRKHAHKTDIRKRKNYISGKKKKIFFYPKKINENFQTHTHRLVLCTCVFPRLP